MKLSRVEVALDSNLLILEMSNCKLSKKIFHHNCFENFWRKIFQHHGNHNHVFKITDIEDLRSPPVMRNQNKNTTHVKIESRICTSLHVGMQDGLLDLNPRSNESRSLHLAICRSFFHQLDATCNYCTRGLKNLLNCCSLLTITTMLFFCVPFVELLCKESMVNGRGFLNSNATPSAV